MPLEFTGAEKAGVGCSIPSVATITSAHPAALLHFR